MKRCLSVVAVLLFSGPLQAEAGVLRTFVTGEADETDVIYEATFDPSVAGSGVVTVRITDTVALDGIEFVPGGAPGEVVVGSLGGDIKHFNASAGATLPSFAVGAGPRPSTVLPVGTDIFFVANQFGMAAAPHKIRKVPIGGGPPVDVFDGAAASGLGLENLEGLEVVGDRLYFFANDHTSPTSRALYSIALTPGGDWDSAPPVQHIGGLAKGPAGDGSDELDFDPFTGLLFGTNIINGEVIAFDPFSGTEVFSPGSAHFIDGTQVSSGLATGLSLLSLEIDGIRSDGAGHLVFAGRGGVLGSIDIGGVMADGADDVDVFALFLDTSGFTVFDDLTSLATVPEPSTFALLGLGAIGLIGYRRRSRGRVARQ